MVQLLLHWVSIIHRNALVPYHCLLNTLMPPPEVRTLVGAVHVYPPVTLPPNHSYPHARHSIHLPILEPKPLIHKVRISIHELIANMDPDIRQVEGIFNPKHLSQLQ